jgi:DNA-binding SARP family transcriptional activator/tetratricopeptide (TPR) repeat protein
VCSLNPLVGATLVEFGILGAITARAAGRVVDLGPARQQCVLAVLLVAANQPISPSQLADRIWGENPPYRAAGTLRSYLSRLRTALPADEQFGIHRRPGGYLLTIDESTVDLHRFRRLLAEGKQADSDDDAAKLYREALRLWRGEPFAGLDTEWLAGVRDTLQTEYLAAQLDYHDVQLRRGQHAMMAAELPALAVTHPWNERLAGQLLLALYRNGHQAGALEHYNQLRVRLAEEFGVDPSPPLRQLYQQILAADPALGQAPVVAVPRQLPALPRGFAGRARELELLDQARGTAVISAIGGIGGIGKTWLALHWAHRNADRFPDGQLYVNLHGFDPNNDPMPAATAARGFLVALGVSADALPTELDAQSAMLRSLLADKRMLMVLDNARDTAQVTPLLPGSPRCTVLITSRNRLTGLVASVGATALDLDTLSESESRQLLATQTSPERLAAEPDAVAELLGYCAGLPLALGIMAARANTYPGFPLSAFADELRDSSTRLDALHGDDIATNLRSVLSWSFAALKPEPARVFALLGLVPGPEVSLAAAASVAGLSTSAARQVLRDLESVHLVSQHVPARYRMHDLVRLYANELADNTDTEALTRVFDHYLHTGHRAAVLLKPHRQQLDLAAPADLVTLTGLTGTQQAMAWFDTEYPMLLAAIQRAAERGLPTYAWQIAWTMADFFERRGQWRDYVATRRIALTAAEQLADIDAQARIHRGLARAHVQIGDYQQAHDHQARAFELYRQCGNLVGQAHTEIGTGKVFERQGQPRLALERAQRGLAIFRTLDNRSGLATALNAVGWCHALLGEHQHALECCQESLALHQEVGDRHGQAGTWDSVGYAHYQLGQHHEAIESFQQSLALATELGDRGTTAEALGHLGDTYQALGAAAKAEEFWCQAVHVLDQLGSPGADRMRAKLSQYSRTAVDQGRPEIGPVRVNGA